ncbi:sugar phosphate isomerase/epimerase family protein [Paenibacillus xylaniclasticus]|uniref:sugar phosphate isomerase/epimerase family protein n=1 Tax=Paenibacillus xylaniclasticus TaxID=588083 RepID=UPI000FD7EFD4|nr:MULTISPECIES: sugar phosphate isomerase/epimerase [Paenibacillus]GFN30869.1 sugar phosphate isomerase [Paenibacillus curdlanolyticus]
MQRMGIGVQLYTLRDEMEKDVPGTLRKVAELGFEGVEFAGYFNIPADQMRALLDENGLKAFSTHVDLTRFKKDLQGEIEYAKVIGAQYIPCSFIQPEDRQHPEDWSGIFDFLLTVAEEVSKEGLQFCYHNHEFEFETKLDGVSVYDKLFATIDGKIMQSELDVCWVQYAKEDPISLIRQLSGRIPLLHTKDFKRGEDNSMITLQLGQGEVDLLSVLEEASRAGVQWLVVEQDYCQNPPFESVEASLNWLKQHYLTRVGVC